MEQGGSFVGYKAQSVLGLGSQHRTGSVSHFSDHFVFANKDKKGSTCECLFASCEAMVNSDECLGETIEIYLSKVAWSWAIF